MSTYRVSNPSPLQHSRYKTDNESSLVPNNQPGYQVRYDEQTKQHTQKDSPISSENRSRIKSSYEVGRSGISQKYEKTENSYSPIIKSTYQRDVSPTFQKSENYKLIDSYEVRLMKLSSENGQLQSQLFQDQQKYNQIIIDFELQTKCLEQKLQTEIMNIQQHKLLIQNKNEEINAQTQEMLRLEQKYFDLESKMFSQQKEMGLLRQQNDAKNIEIENLRQYIKELQSKNLRDIEESKLVVDVNIRKTYEFQIKEIQLQHENNLSRLNDHLKQEQQKYNRLLSQFEQVNSENGFLSIKMNDQKLEKEKLQEDNLRLQRNLEELKQQLQELLRENDSQRDRQLSQDKNHQHTLNELKSHYEYMKKSQVEREIKEFTLKFQSERLNYESQIRQLNQRLIEYEGKFNAKVEENKSLQQKISGIESELRIFISDHEHFKRIKENEFQDVQSEAQKQKQIILDSQQKLQNLQHEITRLNQIINEYKIEIDLVKAQSNDIQYQIKQEFESEIQNLQQKHQQECRLMQDQINEQKNQIYQLDQIFKQKDDQIHSQQLHISQLQGQLDNLQDKLENLEKIKEQEIQQYQQDIQTISQDQNIISQKIQHEKSQLEQQIKQFKQRINELETQLMQQEFNFEQIKQEIEGKLQQKDFQLQQLQNDKSSANQQTQLQKQKNEQLEKLVAELREQNQSIIQEIDDLKQQNETDRAQFVKKELGLENKIQQLKQQLNQREQELEFQLNELDSTHNKFRQQELITQQSQDEFKRREHQYVQEITNLKQLMDNKQQRESEYQSMRETLQEQVQSLQEKSQNREREAEEFRDKYEELREEFNQYIEEMNLKIEYYQRFEFERKESDHKSQAELHSANDRIKELELEVESQKIRLNQYSKERIELENTINEKSKEIEFLKNQLNKDYISNEEYSILQRKYNDQTEELHLLEQMQIKFGTEKKQLERQIDKLNHDLELKDQELQQIDNLMKRRRSEQDELNRKIDQQARELQKTQHDVVEAQAQLGTRNDQINALKRENEDLQIQLAATKKQLEKTQEQLNKKNQELIDKINEAEMKKSYSSGEPTAKVVQQTTFIKTSQVQFGTPLIPEEESQKGSDRSDLKNATTS